MRYYISLILIIIYFPLFSQTPSFKGHPFLHMANVNDSLYVDEYETSLLDWAVFLSSIGRDSSHSYLKNMLPDSLLIKPECRTILRPFYFKEKFFYTQHEYYKESKTFDYTLNIIKDFKEEYFDKSKKRKSSIPVTGISFEQAVEYCKWRTRYLTDRMKSFSIESKYIQGHTVSFRLPTPSEMEYLIKFQSIIRNVKESILTLQQKNIYPPIDSQTSRCPLFNYKWVKPCPSYQALYTEGPFPVGTFFSSCIGAYDMVGNVAEMTSDKGKAKGGSFAHYAREGMPEEINDYKKPEAWLGFRCIMDWR